MLPAVSALFFASLALPAEPVVLLAKPRLTVSFEATPEIFPESWRDQEIKATAESIDPEEQPTALKTVQSALTKYPQAVIESNLKTVHVTRSLSFYGLNYGGTNSSDAVYLTLMPGRRLTTFSHLFLERTFHHEFSSILLRNYWNQFPEKDWNQALPAEFKYRGNGTQSVREGTASTRYSDQYNSLGFLAEYSTSSLEEDFNMLAEGLFSGDPRFWKIYDNYPLIAKKADLIITFYNRIDPTFTKPAIRQLAQASNR
ncbi:hypothetical protein C0431_10530 [bacterium]|nr:hypothetical protein [bacterium]